MRPLISRRTVLAHVGVGPFTGARTARAQPSGAGVQGSAWCPPSPRSTGCRPTGGRLDLQGVLDGMRALGYVEGQNLVVERRSLEGHVARVPAVLGDLVHVIMVPVIAYAKVARDVTETISFSSSLERTRGGGSRMVTKVDHIELVVHRFDEYLALFRALGFRELTRTKHHGDSVEFQLPGENQPIFELHRVSGEENIGVNHIAFQVPDVKAAQRELAARGIAAGVSPSFVPSTGRTNLNFRDPDGWRLQLVDASRAAPDPAAKH